MIKRILIFTGVYLLLLFLFHTLFYQFDYTLESASDSLFYIGIVSLFSGLVAVTNAQNVFIGFRYFVVQLFKRKSDPDKVTYAEYKDLKMHTKFTYVSVVILIVGAVFVAASLILGFASYA